MEQQATIRRARSLPAGLQRIELQSVSGSMNGQPEASTRISSTAEVTGATIDFVRGGRKRTAKVATPVVAAWSLLECLPLLPWATTKPYEFTLLDDGDLLKPAQRLLPSGTTEAKVAGGQALNLRCWEHTGYGVLPTYYWLDEQGRTLFSVSGQRAYLYSSTELNTAPSRRRKRQR